MKKIKNNFQAVFEGIKTSADGNIEIYYHEYFHRSDEADGRNFGFSAFVEDKNLLGRLKELETGAEINLETETRLSETELKTVLVSFDCLEKIKVAPRRISAKRNMLRA